MTWLLDIGDSLVQARRAAGLSQRELAERVGVRQQQIARWESERYGCVSLARLNGVVEALALTGPSEPMPLIAAEPCGVYNTSSMVASATSVRPVRDLGEVIARIRADADELRESFGITRIAVFGSFARGEQRPHSDVDLLVEFEDSSPENVLGAEDRLESILARKVDVGSLEALRPRVRSYVRREAVDVWSARRGRAS